MQEIATKCIVILALHINYNIYLSPCINLFVSLFKSHVFQLEWHQDYETHTADLYLKVRPMGNKGNLPLSVNASFFSITGNFYPVCWPFTTSTKAPLQAVISIAHLIHNSWGIFWSTEHFVKSFLPLNTTTTPNLILHSRCIQDVWYFISSCWGHLTKAEKLRF